MGEAKRVKAARTTVTTDNKPAETIHIKKFQDGRETPTDMHRRLGVAMKCIGCGQAAAIVIRTFVTIEDLYAKQPELAGLIMARNPDGPYVPTTKMKFGNMVRIAQAGACTRCAPDAERAAAKAPDWCLVEVSRGPKEKIVVSVPKTFRVEGAVS